MKLKKLFFWISVIFVFPIVAAGFLCAIPAIAFYKGFELAKSMIDGGEI